MNFQALGKKGLYILVILSLLLLGNPSIVLGQEPDGSQGPDEAPILLAAEGNEVPSPYYDSILYSEIKPKLDEIAATSNRVKVEVIGQSAGGRDLYLVTVATPETLALLDRYRDLRQKMLKDPSRAQQAIEAFGDFKVPIFINGSIHGNEYPGVDAAIRLIETFAYEDTEEVRWILDNVILLFNVVQNPDGRVLGTRTNANGFDINRDFITQSQPEARATVKILTEWNPMVVLDLHGFVDPMLIEPCTPPHNPNYEYDLYIKWAFYEAEAMEAELLARTGWSAQIPFRDFDLGWDDWPPTYTPMYGMFHGGYGHTLETPYRDTRGVDAQYWAVWGALKFAAQNRWAMTYDQIEIFRRGFLDLPQLLIPDEILNETQFDQFNELTVTEFPAAYVIPPGSQFQHNPLAAAKLINFLLANDVQVEQANRAFQMNGTEFPAGTYIVWMDQPKRGLGKTILEAGLDLSYIEGLTFYSPPAVWSNPLLWGVSLWVMQDDQAIRTHLVRAPVAVAGTIVGNRPAAYAFLPNSLEAFRAANSLISRGVAVSRATAAFEDRGRPFSQGTFILPADSALAGQVAQEFALEVFALRTLPPATQALQQQRIAVAGDEGTRWALQMLGFQFDALTSSAINAGSLANYDVLINQSLRWSNLNTTGKANLLAFLNGGGTYLGLTSRGVGFAYDSALLPITFATGSGNAIVKLNYNQADPVAAGYRPQDYAFVNTPVWFTSLGSGVSVSAAYEPGSFLVSGYWPGWTASGAAGAPVIVSGAYGAGEVTLVGIDATFRGHPENTFRLLANAIFAGLEQ